MRASLFSILRERNFPRAVSGSKKTELCFPLRTKSAQGGGGPHPPSAPHTHAHPTHTYGRLRPYTHIRPHTAAGRRPASLSGRRHAAQRLASRWPAGWPAGRPWAVRPAPGHKIRFRIIKIPIFQMVPKYDNNTPMGPKMPSNHIKLHFCASNHILLTPCQGKLLQGSVSFAPMAFGNCSKPQSAESWIWFSRANQPRTSSGVVRR